MPQLGENIGKASKLLSRRHIVESSPMNGHIVCRHVQHLPSLFPYLSQRFINTEHILTSLNKKYNMDALVFSMLKG